MDLVAGISFMLFFLSLFVLLQAIVRYGVDVFRYYGHSYVVDGELRVDLRAIAMRLGISRNGVISKIVKSMCGFSDGDFKQIVEIIYDGVGSSSFIQNATNSLSPSAISSILKRTVSIRSTSGPNQDPADDLENPLIEEDEEAQAVDMGEMCCVCILEYAEGDEVKVLPCNHYFHEECIGDWLKRQNNCPICKHEIPCGTDEEEAETAADPVTSEAISQPPAEVPC